MLHIERSAFETEMLPCLSFIYMDFPLFRQYPPRSSQSAPNAKLKLTTPNKTNTDEAISRSQGIRGVQNFTPSPDLCSLFFAPQSPCKAPAGGRGVTKNEYKHRAFGSRGRSEVADPPIIRNTTHLQRNVDNDTNRMVHFHSSVKVRRRKMNIVPHHDMIRS